MTRDEFIDGYVARSGIAEYRTADGFKIDGHTSVALPCNCCEEGCEGWAMISGPFVRWHLFQNTNAAIENPAKFDTEAEGLALAGSGIASLTVEGEG